MAKYSYITDKTHNNRKIQVESAKRDGSGKNIENNYAKQNGNYQSLTAGLSNNFDTKKVMVDESAYNFRHTATMGSVELEVGSPCKVKKIIGGTIVFNQQANWTDKWNEYYSTTNNNITISDFPDNFNGVSFSVTQSITGHKYLIDIKSDTNYIKLFNYWLNVDIATSNAPKIYAENHGYSIALGYTNEISAGTHPLSITFIDLTQMFGSTIADYIYSLEQANAGSGVAWFKRYFPKEYYAYNSGELVSVKTQGKKITHFNQWDEEWELGFIDGTTGQNSPSSATIRSKNYIRVIPNTTYRWTAPYYCNIRLYGDNKEYIGYEVWAKDTTHQISNNVHYIRFVMPSEYGTTYNHDICINFHYDGERDGEYEPYNSETYACDDIELRGIPQLDENNNLAFDGDEYANDGNVTRKYGIVDLGTLTWVWGGDGNAYCDELTSVMSKDNVSLISGDYVHISTADTSGYWGMTIDKCYYSNSEGRLYLRNINATSSTTLVQLLNGVYLVYELATPTDENSIPFTEVQECDNWGTEEWLAPTTDTRPCEVPVGHETDYLPDLKAKLEVAPNTPNENGVYVMEHNASGNTYTPIATWLANNGYKTEEAMKDTFGMKDALGGTLRQCLCVKESLDFDNTEYVDLGSFIWYVAPNLGFFAQSTAWANGTHLLTTKYKTSNTEVQGTCYISNGNLLIYDNSYNNDATTFKNAMKGVLLAYEKAS